MLDFAAANTLPDLFPLPLVVLLPFGSVQEPLIPNRRVPCPTLSVGGCGFSPDSTDDGFPSAPKP
jgi:hypothetical protein